MLAAQVIGATTSFHLARRMGRNPRLTVIAKVPEGITPPAEKAAFASEAE